MASVWSELKRRNVVRVALAYAIAGWLILQVTDVLVSLLSLPDSAGRFVLLFVLMGFPLAIFFAWAFELTPDGIKRDKETSGGESRVEKQPRRRLDLLIIGGLGIAIVILLAERYLWTPTAPTPTPAATEQSVAVLPFINMSSDPEQEYFSDGIAEELLNRLTRIPGLHVAGRTSSFAFKGKDVDLRTIGKNLNVSHILEGSVRKDADRVRISVQLVKASDGYHLWSRTYDRHLDDIFAIQEEIAESVANVLSVGLGVGESDLSVEGTRVFEAYDAYLAGLALENQWGPENVRRSIARFEEAVALDPQYADAWSELAFTYGLAADFIPERADAYEQKSAAAVSRTKEIAPGTFSSLIAEAQLQERKRKWQKAERSFREALDLAPAGYAANIGYGSFLLVVGRARHSTEYLQEAIRTEPLFLAPVALLAEAHARLGDFDRALKEYDRTKDLIGDQAIIRNSVLITAMASGDRELVEATLEEIWSHDQTPPQVRSLTQAMRSVLHTPEAAQAELHSLYEQPDFDDPLARNLLAVWASYFDDQDLALEILLDLNEAGHLPLLAIWSPIHERTAESSWLRQASGIRRFDRVLGKDRALARRTYSPPGGGHHRHGLPPPGHPASDDSLSLDGL